MSNSVGFQRITGLAAGLLGGFLAGLAGVGGGILMIPIMTAVTGLSQHQAHGTSLVAIVFTGLAGAITYFLHGAVDWKVALILGVTAILTAHAGAHYAHSLSERKLRRGFGIFLVCASTILLVKGWLLHVTFAFTLWPRIFVLLLAGAFAGFLSGMMGVGGGVVMIPFMVVLAGMGQHVAQGTSLLAMVLIGTSGALAHYRLGNVHVPVATGLVIGAVIGVYLGGTLANKIPEIYLRLIFASIGILMGMRYVRR